MIRPIGIVIAIVNVEFWTGAFTAAQEPLSLTAFAPSAGTTYTIVTAGSVVPRVIV